MTDDARATGDGRPIPITGDRHVSDAVYYHIGDVSEWAEATVMYVGSAMAAGVLGNVTYDAIKAALGRLRRREFTPDARTPDPDILLLAQTMVNVRCAELGIDELAGDDVDAFCPRAPDNSLVMFHRHRGRGWAGVWLSVDEQTEDIKAAIRLSEDLVSESREEQDDEEVLRVLRAANGLEPSPLE